MLPFFPTPYPDELFYSICARYHLISRNPAMKDTLHDLFGEINPKVSFDFPIKLKYLDENKPNNWLFNSDEIIEKHSHFPLYKPFLNRSSINSFVNIMKDKNPSYGITGVTKGKGEFLELPKRFRYCPKCIKNDIEIYGEPYWHRTHQVSFVRICPHHECWLVESNTPLSIAKKKYGFYALTEEVHLANFMNLEIAPFYDIFLYLSKSVYYILNNRMPELEIIELKNHYLHFLDKTNFVTVKGKVRQKELYVELRDYYSPDFFSLLFGVDTEIPWFRNIFKYSDEPTHPIFHLLLIKFLDIPVKAFFENINSYELPIGSGPWECLNPAADHYKEKVVKDCNLSWSYEVKRKIGTFSCTCGFIYTLELEKGEVIGNEKIKSIISYGEVWESKLYSFLNQGTSVKEIARLLNVSESTIFRYQKKAKLNIPKQSFEKNRKKWLELTKGNENKTRTELSKLNKRLYVWLKKHDDEWFEKILPQPNLRNQINWGKRDAEYCIKIDYAVNEILESTNKPERITKAAIAKKIGIDFYYTNAEELPKTNSKLNSLIESFEGFQLRSVKWGINELKSKNLKVNKTNLRKIRCLGDEITDNTLELLKKEISSVEQEK